MWSIVRWRAVIVAAVLAAWQFLPQIDWLQSRFAVFDPFFISSPTRIAAYLVSMLTGSGGVASVWPFLAYTLKGTVLGVALGIVAGAAVGLLFSHNATVARIFRPFLTLMNATPRIALVPVVVIVAGPTTTMSVITAFIVVFFLAFYNGFSGGRSVPVQVIENARLLGASSAEVMWQIRLPYVIVWIFASIPNAISFGLVSVVTAELLSGQPGMGQLIMAAVANADATLTFSIVVILAVVGTVLVMVSDSVQRRVLHWWDRQP